MSSCQNVTLSLMFSLLPVTTPRRSPPQRPPWTQGNEWQGGGGCWRGVSWGCHGAEVLFARESRPTGPLLALAVSQAPPAHKKSIYVGIFIDWLPLVLHVFRATHY